MLPRRSATLLAVAAAFTLAACGGNDDGPSPASHPAGLLTAGDFDTASTGSESSNLMVALKAAGFPLDTTSLEDSTSIAALLAGKDIIFLPETSPTFDAGTQAILKAFVDGGGTIVLVGGYDHVDWVNSAFGWSLATGADWDGQEPMPKASGAAASPFFSGPASIPANDGGEQLTAASLPTGAKIAYEGPNGDTDASVAILPSGSGRLIYFGWDWFDGAPFGSQDGGWRILLTKTAAF